MTMAKKYKAADLCRELGIQPYVLRYWETEFPTLRDQMVGSSTYTEEALEIARRIKALLYDEGYTIVGAKKKLAAPEPEIVQTTLPTGEAEEESAEAGDDAETEAVDEDEDDGEGSAEDSEPDVAPEEDDHTVADDEDGSVVDEEAAADPASEGADEDDPQEQPENMTSTATEDADDGDLSESEVLDTIDAERIERMARRAAALRDLAAQLLSDLQGSSDR